MGNATRRTYGHILKWTSFFGGIQIFSLLASLARNKIAAVLLGPMGLGFISLYNAAIKLLNESTNFGISFSAVRTVAEYADGSDDARLLSAVQTIRLWSVATALFGVVVCCLLSPFLSMIYFETPAEWGRFLLLSPIVFLLAVTGGELAILKGMRRLRQIAMQSVVNACACIFVTVPFFYLWGLDGIIPALIAVSVTTAITVLWFSFNLFPYRFSSPLRRVFHDGFGMLRMGVAFVFAGILGAGTEFVVRAFIMQIGSVADVGLYNAGYVITVTYASVIFTSMESDYFPRLSAVNRHKIKANDTVNRQIEVLMLLLSPLLSAFLLLLPIVLPLLYSTDFLVVTDMVRFGILSMMLRAIMLPMEYLSLAKGRSKVYLITEAFYDIAMVSAVTIGYYLEGLTGAGVGLLVASGLGLVFDCCVCKCFYRFFIDKSAIKIICIQFLMIIATYCVVVFSHGVCYWVFGGLCFLLSAIVSYCIFRRTNDTPPLFAHKLLIIKEIFVGIMRGWKKSRK